MHSDSFFTIGSTHQICQDYAWAQNIYPKIEGPPITTAFVADGCSSSPHTDFGARLLIRAALKQLQFSLPLLSEIKINPLAVIRETDLQAQIMNLPQQSLDATLLAAFNNEYGSIHVFLCGDGVVIAQRPDNNFDYYIIEYNNNTPAYLSYTLDQDRYKAYFAQQNGAEGKMTRYSPFFPVPIVYNLWTKHCCPNNFFTTLTFTQKDTKLVMLVTDGILSFQRKTEDGTHEHIEVKEVIEQLLDIKSFTGNFMARRCQKFLKTFCKENGWFHTDDLAVAAIYLNE